MVAVLYYVRVNPVAYTAVIYRLTTVCVCVRACMHACVCVCQRYMHYVRGKGNQSLRTGTHTRSGPHGRTDSAVLFRYLCVCKTQKHVDSGSPASHTGWKTQNITCQERSVNECQHTNAHTCTRSITHTHTHSLTHRLQATGLLFNIPEPPPTVKGVIERALSPGATKPRQAF